MKNLQEFKSLIKRYETITLSEIQKHWNKYGGWVTARNLTGFGTQGSCTLCLALGPIENKRKKKCVECVYGRYHQCIMDGNKDTYYKIFYATTPVELLKAFRQRAKHMKTIIKPHRRKRCDHCGQLKPKEEVSYIINPYEDDIEGKIIYENLRNTCYQNLLYDI
jgi:hypothetical protein